MQRFVDEFVALDVRIARLCHALDLNLRSEADLSAILQRSAPGFSHADAAAASNAGEGERHAWHSREEVRGLLVMRCDLLTRVVDTWGLGAAREIVDMAEADLLRQGFPPGADGITLAKRLADLGLAPPLGDA
jgi:hypothetical protein